jgi:hypothetical protein
VVVPHTVDSQPLVRLKPFKMGIEVALKCRDVGAMSLGLAERDAAYDGCGRWDAVRFHR